MSRAPTFAKDAKSSVAATDAQYEFSALWGWMINADLNAKCAPQAGQAPVREGTQSQQRLPDFSLFTIH